MSLLPCNLVGHDEDTVFVWADDYNPTSNRGKNSRP